MLRYLPSKWGLALTFRSFPVHLEGNGWQYSISFFYSNCQFTLFDRIHRPFTLLARSSWRLRSALIVHGDYGSFVDEPSSAILPSYNHCKYPSKCPATSVTLSACSSHSTTSPMRGAVRATSLNCSPRCVHAASESRKRRLTSSSSAICLNSSDESVGDGFRTPWLR